MAERAPYASASSTEEHGSRYRYVVIGTLAFAYMLNFIDRQLLSVLVEPIKHDLGLSDTQIGLLTGLMFALFYSLFGIPVAMIADKGNRTRLIAIACGIWSFFTALSGMATGFVSLALARIGVGVGEAGCSPPSHSISSDYFPPEQRGRAMALYVLGLPIGGFIGTFAGGWIAEHYGWRYPFFVVGLIGLVFAPLLPLLVREPARGRFDILEPGNLAKDARVQSFADGIKFFWSSPILVLTALGCGLTSFCANGLLNWAPAYLGGVQGM